MGGIQVLFLDIETTGLKPESSLVWQVVFAKALRKDKVLELLEVVELVGKECILNPEVRQALEWADLLVAHNVAFEKGFLEYRGLPVPVESYCTMIEATDICGIPRYAYVEEYEWEGYARVGNKWPKLREAIDRLGLKDPLSRLVRGSFHDALFDIYATLVLYARLEGLELKTDGHRRKTSGLLKKYLTAKEYAIPEYREEVLSGILNQSLVYRVLSFPVKKWRRVHGFLGRCRTFINRGGRDDLDDIPF